MKQTLLFRLWSMMTVLFYSTALAQAGQVITQTDRSWAQEAMKHEAGLSTINTPNSIAVLDFNNKSGKDKLNPLQKGLAVMLIADLAKIEQLQVVERVRMQALLDEMNLGASGVVDPESISKVGKLLGAYYVASGNILKGKKQDIAIDSSILDTPFETVTQQPTVTGAMDELFKLEKEVLFNIIAQLKIPVSPEKRTELQKPLSTSTAALLALFLGIDHSDKGQYAEAANMYEQALVEDPNLKMAKNALQEIKGMGSTVVESPLTTPPAEADGSSMTVLGVGLAVVALGAAAFALSGSSDGGDDGGGGGTLPDEIVPVPDDTTAPTANSSPRQGSTLSCTGGFITFSFSEPMEQQFGHATLTPKDFESSQEWRDGDYVITWNHDYDFCSGLTSLQIILNGFQDSSGNALIGTEFSYHVDR